MALKIGDKEVTNLAVGDSLFSKNYADENYHVVGTVNDEYYDSYHSINGDYISTDFMPEADSETKEKVYSAGIKDYLVLGELHYKGVAYLAITDFHQAGDQIYATIVKKSDVVIQKKNGG